MGLLSHREPEEWMPKPGHWMQNPTGKAVDQTTFQATQSPMIGKPRVKKQKELRLEKGPRAAPEGKGRGI